MIAWFHVMGAIIVIMVVAYVTMGSKVTCCLECIVLHDFCFLCTVHRAYITAVQEPHACVQMKAVLALRSQTRKIGLYILYSGCIKIIVYVLF